MRSDVVRRLDPHVDVYLRDHQIDGRPVLPFAMALELMAEVAAAGWPAYEVLELSQVRLLRGISVPADGCEVLISARATRGQTAGEASLPGGLLVDVTIVGHGAEPARPHYQARVRLGRPADLAEKLPDAPPLGGATGRLPLSLPHAYRDWLFHGPLFQHVSEVEAIGLAGARSTLRASIPSACVVGAAGAEWLIDPVVVDSALQVNVLWARHHWDMTILPGYLERYRRLGSLRGGPLRHELRIRPDTRAPLVRADHYVYDANQRLQGVLYGMEGTGSSALNRLAGTRDG